MNATERKEVVSKLEGLMAHEVNLAVAMVDNQKPSDRKDAIYNACIIAETMGAKWWTDEDEKPSFNKE